MADKIIRDSKFQSEKDTKAITRRAEEDIAFKKRQLKELEQDINRSKIKCNNLKRMLKNYKISLKKN